MTETLLPARVLLGADLSARCDRALARAALLARAWRSEPTVTHVVHPAEVAARGRLTNGTPSWRRPQSGSQRPEGLLRAEPAAEGIAATPPVVMGSQGRRGLARALLGSTAEHLLHALDGDTLVVRAA